MLIARETSCLKMNDYLLKCLISGLQRVNLAFSLIKDAFAILERSKCDCLLVLHLKDGYHTVIFFQTVPNCVVTFTLFGSARYVYQRMPNSLCASPAIWQFYINASYS